MEETAAKTAKIVELLDYIEARLAELEEEKEELKEYQTKDKERRCLEYAIYKRDLEEVAEKLEVIEEERRNAVHNSNLGREESNQRAQEIKVRVYVSVAPIWLTYLLRIAKLELLPPPMTSQPFTQYATRQKASYCSSERSKLYCNSSYQTPR